MNSNEFIGELEIMKRAYPNAFPGIIEPIALIWFSHFSHYPLDLFKQACHYCREHERFLSIASLRSSIIAVADIPKSHEIREMVLEQNGKGHEIARQVHRELGGYTTITHMKPEAFDRQFEREYKRAAEDWINFSMKPENIEQLTTGIKQIEGNKPIKNDAQAIFNRTDPETQESRRKALKAAKDLAGGMRG